MFKWKLKIQKLKWKLEQIWLWYNVRAYAKVCKWVDKTVHEKIYSDPAVHKCKLPSVNNNNVVHYTCQR